MYVSRDEVNPVSCKFAVVEIKRSTVLFGGTNAFTCLSLYQTTKFQTSPN